MTPQERIIWQRQYRIDTNNSCTKKYEKTINGFLVRLYRNMQSRVTGIQKKKAHLYKDKELFDREWFYDWAKGNIQFLIKYKRWQLSNFDRKLCPSVDRIDSTLGYISTNVEWVTHSENSRRGANNRWLKYL